MNKSKTEAVIQRWGVDEDLTQENVRQAASSYARIKIQNKTLKWVTLGGVVFLLVMLGIMIASVIIGVKITKEFKEKDGVLVKESNSKVTLQTAPLEYKVKLDLATPLSVIRNLKSLKFVIQGKDGGSSGIMQFNVVSFYYAKGRKITLYGHTHMANMLRDGSFELFPIEISNSRRYFNSAKRDVATNLTITSEISNPVVNKLIYTCDDLLNMEKDPSGEYEIVQDELTCTFTEPLFKNQSFTGTINGNGNKVYINIDSDEDVAFMFSTKGANFTNLFLYGNLRGRGRCAGMVVEAHSGTAFVHSASYFNISCGPKLNATSEANIVVFGGLAAVLKYDSSKPVIIEKSIPKNAVDLYDLGDAYNFQGGLYGFKDPDVDVKFDLPTSANLMLKYNNNSFAHAIGFVFSTGVAKSNKRTVGIYAAQNGVPLASVITITEENCYDDYNLSVIDLTFVTQCVTYYVRNGYDLDCCLNVKVPTCQIAYCLPGQYCAFCNANRFNNQRTIVNGSLELGFNELEIFPQLKCKDN